MDLEKIGRYLFLVGLVISVVAGFINIGTWGAVVLFAIGIVVGVLNVTGQEVHRFLMGTVALMLVGTASLSLITEVPGGAVASVIIRYFTAFVAGGALVVALKEVYSITSTK
jgi:hypothetical protein